MAFLFLLKMHQELKLIKIGKLSKAKGLKGHVHAFIEPNFVVRLKKTNVLYIKIKESNILPYFVDEYEMAHTGHSLFLFEGINDRTEAEVLHSKEIYTEESNLKKTKKFDSLDYLIGYQVIDEKLGFIGLVDEVIDMPSHPIVHVYFNDKLVLIPLVNEYNLDINHRKKSINLLLPDGLLTL